MVLLLNDGVFSVQNTFAEANADPFETNNMKHNNNV